MMSVQRNEETMARMMTYPQTWQHPNMIPPSAIPASVVVPLSLALGTAGSDTGDSISTMNPNDPRTMGDVSKLPACAHWLYCLPLELDLKSRFFTVL